MENNIKAMKKAAVILEKYYNSNEVQEWLNTPLGAFDLTEEKRGQINCQVINFLAENRSNIRRIILESMIKYTDEKGSRRLANYDYFHLANYCAFNIFWFFKDKSQKHL